MTTLAIERYLAEQRFFSGLASESLVFLGQCAVPRTLEAGEILIRHGDRANAFYVVRSGSIAREVPAIQGPSFLMESLGPGNVLGWSWLIPPYRWSFQARAEIGSELLAFDGACVLERCEADVRFGYELLKRFSVLMSDRLMTARRKMAEEYFTPGFA